MAAEMTRSSNQASPYNVLLILTDQHRYDALGCNGNPVVKTPHLDALAGRGVRFSNAFTGILPCSPSRACLFTGRYGHRNGVTINGGCLNPGIPNLGTEARDAGCRIGYAGKWHVDRQRNPSDFGFEGKDFPGYGYPWSAEIVEGNTFGAGMGDERNIEHYLAYLRKHGLEPPRIEAHFKSASRNSSIYGRQSGTLKHSFENMVAEDTMELLRSFAAHRRETDQPFFLWSNFWGPHRPMVIPEPYFSMYRPEDVPYDPAYAETFANKPAVHREFSELSTGFGEEESWETWQKIIARYWGYVTMLDDLIGQILDLLRDLGEEDRTLVVFASDHGDLMGAHRQLEKGPSCYDDAYQIPLIAAHPECGTPGHVSSEMVCLHDCFPALLQTLGAHPEPAPDFHNILPCMLDAESKSGREWIFTQFYQQRICIDQRMVRTRTHKFVFNRNDLDELYDLTEDPRELRNRIDDPQMAGIRHELQQKLVASLTELSDPLLEVFRSERIMP